MQNAILQLKPLSFPWETLDPFLFCVYHNDTYPVGNEVMGPLASLSGRNLGNDFTVKDGWRMYHGKIIPGFPPHPHRGFETVTVVRQGRIDHTDSMGATARFGDGDTQWLTAGKGIVHAEMFPLLDEKKSNPLELFQIWLNLPAKDKMAEPHFTMLWDNLIPKIRVPDTKGCYTEVTLIAGRYGDLIAPPPPPHSWAHNPESDVAIWTLRMEPHAQWMIPATKPKSNRALYFFEGDTINIEKRTITPNQVIALTPDAQVVIKNGGKMAELLLLQGKPIGEPIVQYGPFVMNSEAEIRQAYSDYQSTRFGGWPWPSQEPVHERTEGRFARFPDGRVERPIHSLS